MAGGLYNQVEVEHESQRKWVVKKILDKKIMVDSDSEKDSIFEYVED